MHAPLAPEKRILLKAADILREYGWCQDAIEHPDGRRCALGAIAMAARVLGLKEYFHAERAMEKMLPNETVPSWNDAPGRTAEEVIEAMEKAATT